MNTSIQHIFDPTEHLSEEQLNWYAQGQLGGEELHAVERHLVDCPLCESAAEGALLLQQQGKKAGPIILPIAKTNDRFYWRATAAMLVVVLSVGGLLWWKEGTMDKIAQEQSLVTDTIQPQAPTLSDGNTLEEETIETRAKEKETLKTVIPTQAQQESKVPVNNGLAENNPELMMEDLALVSDESKNLDFAPAEEANKPRNQKTEGDDDKTFAFADKKAEEPRKKTVDFSEKEATKKALGKTKDAERTVTVAKTPMATAVPKESPKADSVMLNFATVTDAATITTGSTSQGTVMLTESVASYTWDSGEAAGSQQVFNDALKSYKNKEYQDAIRGFDKLESNPSYRGLALYYKAQCMIKTARYAKAKLSLETLINLKIAESAKAKKTLDSLKATNH
jgi:hypothetical protein